MYNSEFVKKKKRRKVVAVITGISSITVAALVIISFLGKYVGTFTVKLESGSVMKFMTRGLPILQARLSRPEKVSFLVFQSQQTMHLNLFLVALTNSNFLMLAQEEKQPRRLKQKY